MKQTLLIFLFFCFSLNASAVFEEDSCKNDDPNLDPKLAIVYVNGTSESKDVVRTSSVGTIKELVRDRGDCIIGYH